MSLEELIVEASTVLGNFETIQRTLGRISAEVMDTYGWNVLVDFSKSIEENGGLRRSPSTLRNYAWTYKKIKEFDLPDDLPFALCQNIAGLTNPEPFVAMVKEGHSSAEIRKLILEQRKKEHPERVKEIICSLCGGKFILEK